MIYKVGIITASDKGYAGTRKDLSGPAIEEVLSHFKGFKVQKYVMLPDEKDMLSNMMRQMADEDQLDLILTTGGTGFAKRDVTPEATLEVIERRAPGVPEAMRSISFQITPRAMLSRAEAGIRGETLIVNMPGSPKSIKEILEYILPSIEHGLDILQGNTAECARP
ncbi:MAG: molybdenum cofactor synthesis domain protein [Bacillota bacterium]|jgi:molybdenum cofactor synthesis domain-containing protein|nr:molybdenum cofactor synthesis domain protein [Bacillota bacterium]